jgi:endonuclease III
MLNADPVTLLAVHVAEVLGPGPFPPAAGWSHMGAVLSDAVLQAGISYDAVVKPAVLRLQGAWPDADTITGFRARIATEDLGDVLKFHNRRKLATIPALAEDLAHARIDTVLDLRTWLNGEAHRAALLGILGVGPKTVAYLCSLVGIPAVAVDRHLRRFAAEAGIDVRGYVELRTVFEEAADRIGVDRGGLEHAVWRYEANR